MKQSIILPMGVLQFISDNITTNAASCRLFFRTNQVHGLIGMSIAHSRALDEFFGKAAPFGADAEAHRPWVMRGSSASSAAVMADILGKLAEFW